jgi:glycosyltransferase involved in cell wall biosynthesis
MRSAAPEDIRVTLSYALITPARNEEAYIELTIRSVVSQTVPPARWVIVSDGSTDRTDEIVSGYLPSHPWMRLVRMPERAERHFAAKVQCFNAGYRALEEIAFEVVGNLDADISFDPDYFAFLMGQFAADIRLGVAGTPFVERENQVYDYRFTNIEHVSGACQMFRRRCFEEIGGYTPVRGGGIDWIAVTTARMKGWKTRTFTEKSCTHHRVMGTGGGGGLGVWFKHGKKDFALGGHPLWQIFRAAYQMTRRPYIFGGASLLLGYIWAAANRADRPVSRELLQFYQAEQLRRLRAALRLGLKR